jgi:hypothetical protein
MPIQSKRSSGRHGGLGGNLRGAAWAAALAMSVAGAPAHAAAAPACPEFPTPEGAALKWVAPNVVFNGAPLQVKELTTRDTPKQLLEFYRRKWGAEQPYYHEYQLEGWQAAIAALRRKCFYTVQAKSDGNGGTFALLSVSTTPEGGSLKTPGAGFPLAPGSRVVNDIEHYDGGKNGRTLLLVNDLAPDTNVAYYRRALGGDGWTAVLDKSVETPKGSARVLVLKRGYHETSISITPHGGSGSSLLVTSVDRP